MLGQLQAIFRGLHQTFDLLRTVLYRKAWAWNHRLAHFMVWPTNPATSLQIGFKVVCIAIMQNCLDILAIYARTIGNCGYQDTDWTIWFTHWLQNMISIEIIVSTVKHFHTPLRRVTRSFNVHVITKFWHINRISKGGDFDCLAIYDFPLGWSFCSFNSLTNVLNVCTGSGVTTWTA